MKFTNDFVPEPFTGVIHVQESTEYKYEQLMGVMKLMKLTDTRFEEIYEFLKDLNIA